MEESESQKRGQLTKRIKHVSLILMGYEITQTELRLMPYIQNIMVNNQRIDPNKINSAERTILAKWKKEGHIEGGASGLNITRHFWDIINQIIFLGYVDIDD